jgi:hypothetical protein
VRSEGVGETPNRSRISRYLPIFLLAAVIAALWLVPGSDLKSKTLIDAALLVGFAIACWAFGWLAEPATTLVFFLLAWRSPR